MNPTDAQYDAARAWLDMNPTDAQYDAARAWLEAHVKGWTVGQWMLLAMLLASQAAPATTER